jgi:hypothetical protein
VLVWFGLVWFGLVWLCLVVFGCIGWTPSRGWVHGAKGRVGRPIGGQEGRGGRERGERAGRGECSATQEEEECLENECVWREKPPSPTCRRAYG